MNNVHLFRFITGEFVIAKCSYEGSLVHLENPILINIEPTHDGGNAKVTPEAYAPPFFGENITIPLNNIFMLTKEPDKQLVDMWNAINNQNNIVVPDAQTTRILTR